MYIHTCMHAVKYLDVVFSGFGTIENEMATVTISQLMCEQMYTITAGGIIHNPRYKLIGPRFRIETVSAACPTRSSKPISKVYVHSYIACVRTCTDEHTKLVCIVKMGIRKS